jgi:hypothetical protein
MPGSGVALERCPVGSETRFCLERGGSAEPEDVDIRNAADIDRTRSGALAGSGGLLAGSGGLYPATNIPGANIGANLQVQYVKSRNPR